MIYPLERKERKSLRDENAKVTFHWLMIVFGLSTTNFLFKVAEHSFGSSWVYVLCQIMARERLQLKSWNLAGEKYTDERFWLAGKMWRFRSFHGDMNDWIQP